MTGRKNGRGGRAGARTPIAALAVLIGLLVFGVLFPAADATLANRVGGPGLALLYTFDANAGTVVADQTGAGGAKGDPWDQTLNRGYWLTDLGSPLPSGVLINETCVPPCAPPINNATAVTGKLDSITELVPLFASTNAEFSVEAWVEPTDANTAGIIFDSHVAGGADESFACVPGDATFGGDSISLRQVANGTYVCIVGDNGGTPTATECTAADTITAGGRYHVVATVDAASAVTLYVNGAATAAVCTPTATSFGGYATAWAANATERQVSIGARGNGFGTFLGNVHLVAFYTEALNSSEVLRNYETGAFNEAPVPVSAAYNYTEDGNLTVALTATDSDPRDSASFVVTSLPVAGSLFQLSGVGVKGAAIAVNDTVTSPNGELLFEPSPGESGLQTFSFSASDGVDSSIADGVITLSGLAAPTTTAAPTTAAPVTTTGAPVTTTAAPTTAAPTTAAPTTAAPTTAAPTTAAPTTGAPTSTTTTTTTTTTTDAPAGAASSDLDESTFDGPLGDLGVPDEFYGIATFYAGAVLVLVVGAIVATLVTTCCCRAGCCRCCPCCPCCRAPPGPDDGKSSYSDEEAPRPSSSGSASHGGAISDNGGGTAASPGDDLPLPPPPVDSAVTALPPPDLAVDSLPPPPPPDVTVIPPTPAGESPMAGAAGSSSSGGGPPPDGDAVDLEDMDFSDIDLSDDGNNA